MIQGFKIFVPKEDYYNPQPLFVDYNLKSYRLTTVNLLQNQNHDKILKIRLKMKKVCVRIDCPLIILKHIKNSP